MSASRKFQLLEFTSMTLTNVALLFNFIPLDYESIVVVYHGSNIYQTFTEER